MASLAFYMQYFVSDCIPLLTLSLSLPCKLFFIIIISLLLNRHFFSGEKNLLEARSQHKNHKTARLNIGFLLIPCIYSHWFTQTSDIHKSFISQMLKNPVIIDQCFWIIDAKTKMIAAKKQLNRHILGSIFNAKTSLTGLYESDWCFGERNGKVIFNKSNLPFSCHWYFAANQISFVRLFAVKLFLFYSYSSSSRFNLPCVSMNMSQFVFVMLPITFVQIVFLFFFHTWIVKRASHHLSMIATTMCALCFHQLIHLDSKFEYFGTKV